jgi:hypothetical protein
MWYSIAVVLVGLLLVQYSTSTILDHYVLEYAYRPVWALARVLVVHSGLGSVIRVKVRYVLEYSTRYSWPFKK